MTYWMLNVVFLFVVALVVVAAVLTRRHPRWRAAALTGLILLGLTAVFDNIMIGVGLVGYNEELTAPQRLGIAPLEDFSYTVAAVLLLPSLWALTERRQRD